MTNWGSGYSGFVNWSNLHHGAWLLQQLKPGRSMNSRSIVLFLLSILPSISLSGSLPDLILKNGFDDKPFASISGLKWNDLNGNGLREPNEPAIADVTIYLDYNGNCDLDPGDDSTQSALDGSYAFAKVNPDTTVLVCEVVPDLSGQTWPLAGHYALALSPGEAATGLDFGNVEMFARISGEKWHDENANGTKDEPEPPLEGVTIYIDTNSNGQLDYGETSRLTDNAGRYEFTGLASGPIIVTEVVPFGFAPTFPNGALHNISLICPLNNSHFWCKPKHNYPVLQNNVYRLMAV